MSEKHWIESILENGVVIYDLDNQGENVCEVVGDMANAHLIAAAPELLEALKKLLKWHDAFYSTGDADLPIFTEARAAIARAEGAR